MHAAVSVDDLQRGQRIGGDETKLRAVRRPVQIPNVARRFEDRFHFLVGDSCAKERAVQFGIFWGRLIADKSEKAAVPGGCGSLQDQARKTLGNVAMLRVCRFGDVPPVRTVDRADPDARHALLRVFGGAGPERLGLGPTGSRRDADEMAAVR